MKKFFLSALLGGTAAMAFAQDETDALRFSMLMPQGTARSIGFGSALGSIGGDFTSLSVNPAGIGIYRRSEFMISPSILLNNTDATYASEADRDNGARFAFGNVGAVFTAAAKGRAYKRSDWKAVSFGIGLNRLADFSSNYSYTGLNNQNSGSYVFEEDANAAFGNVNDPTRPAYLAYQAYLLDTATLAGGGAGYISVVNPTLPGGVRQTNTVQERGGINELAISLGGNYQEKLMLGATIGIPFLRYTRDRTFTEEDNSGNANNDFDYFDYTESLKTTGAGINFKLGVIYKPADQFRIGAAIHTPTYFGLTDESYADLSANTENFGGQQNIQGTLREYDYNLTTPWRGILSASALLGKSGFVTLDYEYVDYSATRYRFSNTDRNYERYLNQTIRDTYQGASNIRGGAEVKLSNVALRAGLGYYGNPYRHRTDGERMDVSGGIGFRFAKSFIDLAYTHRWWNAAEQPYTLGYTNVGAVPTALLDRAQNNVTLTLGWKF